MTEEEWLTCGDPKAMLEYLVGKASDRKLRLFAVACCRDAAGEASLNWDRFRRDIDLAEQMAEGIADSPSGLDHHFGFYTIHHGSGSSLERVCHAAKAPSARHGALEVARKLDDVFWTNDETNYGGICIRDIFGNPFRPATVDPVWLTSNVVALAEGIYAERAFDRMPILADALQDAGCDRDDILAHCRDTSLTHGRGCWVVDLLLGKK